MDTPVVKPASNRLHPLVAGAAIALILVSLIGVAAMTGLLPSSNSTNAPQQQAMQQQEPPAQVLAAQPEPVSAKPVVQQAQAARPAQQPMQQVAPAHRQAAAVCNSCGEVVAVRAENHTPSTSGVGIAGGAVVGGLLGNQIGGGTGRTLATIAGAVGGGYAGNEVEKRARTTTTYVVDVRMDNGQVRSFPQNGWNVGDQVRVVNGHLQARG